MPSVNPSMAEILGNNIDENCDGDLGSNTSSLVIIGIPAPQTVDCASIPDFPQVSTMDNCPGNTEITFIINFENTICEGSYTIVREFTATNTCGESTTETQFIAVIDDSPPTFTNLPLNISVDCNNIPALATVGAVDDCDNNVTTTYLGETSTGSGCVDNYIIYRNWSAVDDCGNEATYQQSISVINDLGSSMVSIDVDAQNQMVACTDIGTNSGLTDWLNNNGGASAITTCLDSDNITWSNDFAGLSDECGQTGTTNVTFTALDDCGNIAQTTGTFTVSDTQAPVISQQATDLVVVCDGNLNQTEFLPWVAEQGGALAADDCGTVTWSTAFVDPLAFDSDCLQSTVTTAIFTATDDCGNTSTTVANFIVETNCTITGDLIFTTQAQLDAFTETCIILDGNLIINGDDITDLSNLINLVEITGNVIIGDPTPNAIGNNILTNLEGLNNIQRIGGDLIICGNPLLTTLAGFSSLQEVGGDIRVKNCESLTSIIFVSLISVGGDCIYINLPLVTQVMITNFTSFGGSIIINGTGISGFGSGSLGGLTSIGGDLFFINNPNLTFIDLPNLINLGGCFHLINNVILVGNVDLPNLQSIGEDLIIDNMDAITNLDIFDNLTAVNGNVVITNNDLLQNLDGLSNLLNVADDFTLENNQSLTSCCGINPLLEFGSIGGQTNITNNPNGCSSETNILDSCPLELTISCQADIFVDCDMQAAGLDVNWPVPGAATNCNLSDLVEVAQSGGPANGTEFQPGTTIEIIYTATDACGNEVSCSFDIIMEDDDNCFCTPGMACDDNDPCTQQDTYNDDCECLGVLIDADQDGICADEDCNDNDPNLPTAPGTTCDDGDANTDNDVIQSDGCTCQGEVAPDGCNIGVTINNFGVTITGVDDPHVDVKFHDIDNGWTIVSQCFDNCGNPHIANLPEGRYYMSVKTWNDTWEIVCDFTDFFEIGENLCGNVTDGGTIGYDESFESPYDPEAIVNIDAPSGGSGTLEYVWLASTTGCPGVGDEVPNSNSPTYDPGPITQTTYYLRCSRTIGCTTYYESNCLVKEVTGANPNCNISHSHGPDFITTSGMSTEHVDFKLFDNNWNVIAHCFDDCNATETISMLSNGTYYINVKLWNENWEVICEYGVYVTIDGTFSLMGQGDDYLIFNANKDKRVVSLNWATNTEEVNDYFVIERSRDNIHFEILEEVTSMHSDRGDYYYEDQDGEPLLGDNYYRIKTVFADGTFRYSAVQKVFFDIDLNEIKLYPNPTSSEFFLEMKEHLGASVEVSIYNTLGVLMTTRTIDALAAKSIRFDTNHFVNGIYSAKVKIGDLKEKNILFVVSH